MKLLPVSGFEVPKRYHKDLLHLMVRDSYTLYVYWEVSDRKRWLISQHFECDYSMMPTILRVYDVTCIYFDGANAHSSFDLITTPESDNWYIRHLQPGRSYLTDLGTYALEGDFIPLLRSNAVQLPAVRNRT